MDTENDTVTQDDPTTLALKLQNAETEIANLKSNIGRQNDIHGQRVNALTSTVQDLMSKLNEREDTSKKREETAKMASMSPAELALYRAEQAEKRIAEFEAREAERQQEAYERSEIQRLWNIVAKEGMPANKFDSSSFEAAALSVRVWQETKKDQEVEDLKKKVEALTSGLPDAIRATSGARTIVSGNPANTPPPSEQVPAEIQKLFDEFVAITGKRVKTQDDRARLFVIIGEAAKKGYDISA